MAAGALFNVLRLFGSRPRGAQAHKSPRGAGRAKTKRPPRTGRKANPGGVRVCEPARGAFYKAEKTSPIFPFTNRQPGTARAGAPRLTTTSRSPSK